MFFQTTFKHDHKCAKIWQLWLLEMFPNKINVLRELFFKLRKCQCQSIKVLFFQASFENSSSLEWFHRQPSVLSSFDQSEVAKSQISFAKLQVIRIKVLSALHIELQSWVHTEPTQSNKCPISDAFENPLDFCCFQILFSLYQSYQRFWMVHRISYYFNAKWTFFMGDTHCVK